MRNVTKPTMTQKAGMDRPRSSLDAGEEEEVVVVWLEVEVEAIKGAGVLPPRDRARPRPDGAAADRRASSPVAVRAY